MRDEQDTTETDENERAPDLANEEFESAFAWECRVMAVSAIWVLPGVLFGAFTRPVCASKADPRRGGWSAAEFSARSWAGCWKPTTRT